MQVRNTTSEEYEHQKNLSIYSGNSWLSRFKKNLGTSDRGRTEMRSRSWNEYDVFSIKTCQGSGKTVGHLPKEISRARKFLLDRGATVNAKLSSEHYRKSPLFQRGLEIACIITVTMPGTVRNHMVIERYKEIVERFYCEPKNEVVIGRFLENTIGNVTPLAGPSNKKKKTDNKKPPNKKPPPKSRDIRAMFFAQNKKNLADTVVID